LLRDPPLAPPRVGEDDSQRPLHPGGLFSCLCTESVVGWTLLSRLRLGSQCHRGRLDMRASPLSAPLRSARGTVGAMLLFGLRGWAPGPRGWGCAARARARPLQLPLYGECCGLDSPLAPPAGEPMPQGPARYEGLPTERPPPLRQGHGRRNAPVRPAGLGPGPPRLGLRRPSPRQASSAASVRRVLWAGLSSRASGWGANATGAGSI